MSLRVWASVLFLLKKSHLLHVFLAAVAALLAYRGSCGLAMAQILVCVGWAWRDDRGPPAPGIDWLVDARGNWGYWSAEEVSAMLYDGTEFSMHRIRHDLQASFPFLWWTFDHAVALAPNRPPPWDGVR